MNGSSQNSSKSDAAQITCREKAHTGRVERTTCALAKNVERSNLFGELLARVQEFGADPSSTPLLKPNTLRRERKHTNVHNKNRKNQFIFVDLRPHIPIWFWYLMWKQVVI